MISVFSLWLPILLSAVGVFVASSIIHMILPYHRTNMSAIENEDAFADAINPLNIAPGEYMFPHAGSPSAMNSPEYLAKLDRGPVGIMTILPTGPWKMGKSLIQWFIYSLFIGFFCAYLSVHALSAGTEYLRVMQMVGGIAFGCYAIGHIHDSIWYFRKWSTTFKFLFDGLVYSAITGGFFGWLWPAVS